MTESGHKSGLLRQSVFGSPETAMQDLVQKCEKSDSIPRDMRCLEAQGLLRSAFTLVTFQKPSFWATVQGSRRKSATSGLCLMLHDLGPQLLFPTFKGSPQTKQPLNRQHIKLAHTEYQTLQRQQASGKVSTPPLPPYQTAEKNISTFGMSPITCSCLFMVWLGQKDAECRDSLLLPCSL